MLLILAAVSGNVYSAMTDQWSRIEVGDLVVYTDLGADEGAALGRHLLHFRDAIVEFPYPVEEQLNPRAPALELLVFARRKDFTRLMKTRHFAAFTQPGLRRTLLVIAPSGSTAGLYRNARHEYVHYHLRNHPTGYPVWFDEGLAVMLEYLQFDNDSTTARLDTAALFKRYTGRVQERWSPSLGKLLNTTRFDHWSYERLTRFYGLMGQFTHFLYFGQLAGFTDYREALTRHLMQRGPNLATDLATSNTRLARQFEQYRQRTKPDIEIAVEPQTYPVRAQVMSAVARDRVLARAAEEANPAHAIQLYQSIARNSDINADAYVDLARAQLSSGDQTSAAESLSRAEEIMTTPSAHYLLGRASLLSAQCRFDDLPRCRQLWQQASSLIRRALEIDPERTDGMYSQGVIELYRGRPGIAVNYLKAAYGYAPWAPRLNYHLGECLRLLGDPTARIYLGNALAWSHEKHWQEIAQSSLDRLDAGD
ncbi:MAG: hypothetical protein RIC89_04000 [Pseudomonadales bacterium]